MASTIDTPHVAQMAYAMARRLGVEPPLRRKAIQAKHIPDQEIVAACLAWEANKGHHAWLMGLKEYAEALKLGVLSPPPIRALAHKYPEKVLLAKMASMERRGILDPLANTVWTVNQAWLREHPNG